MTEVKLCGMRTLRDARAAVDAGAEYVGFVLAPGYRRRIAPAAAREITASLGRGRARYVGVFVDSDPEEAGRIAAYAGLELVQLSGHESVEEIRAVGVPVIKAVHVRADVDPLPEVRRYAEVAHTVLLDTYQGTAAGGTGESFDWGLAAHAAREHRVMLAGGLTPHNVRDAIAAVGPAVVDVSSGIESNGEKDAVKIGAFVRAVREGS